MPSLVGRGGILEVLKPEMSEDERAGLRHSVETLKQALDRSRKEATPKARARG